MDEPSLVSVFGCELSGVNSLATTLHLVNKRTSLFTNLGTSSMILCYWKTLAVPRGNSLDIFYRAQVPIRG